MHGILFYGIETINLNKMDLKDKVKTILNGNITAHGFLNNYTIDGIDKATTEIVKLFSMHFVSDSFDNLKTDDCWNACTKINADNGHVLNKSAEFNNAFQCGFEACFKWLKNYR